MRFSNRPECFYGKLYRERKQQEIDRNDRNEFADQAKAALESQKFGKETDAFKWYSQGKLPPAQIDARARRHAIKSFLFHWFEQAYRKQYGVDPPQPYVIAHLGHVQKIKANQRD